MQVKLPGSGEKNVIALVIIDGTRRGSANGRRWLFTVLDPLCLAARVGPERQVRLDVVL